MPNLKIGFVNFFKEKRGRKIVNISDIEDFNPSHHSDFDGDRTYLVKWAHLPTVGSSSSEGLYEAKLLCLGVDMDDLLLEAKTQGVKISESMRDEFTSEKAMSKKKKSETPPKSSRGRRLKPSFPIASSGQDPARPNKKKKKSPEDSAKEHRKLKSLENYDNLFSSEMVLKHKDATSKEKDAASEEKNNTSENKGAPSKDLGAASKGKDVTSTKDKNATPKEKNAASEDHGAPSKDLGAASKGMASTPKEIEAGSQGIKSALNEVETELVLGESQEDVNVSDEAPNPLEMDPVLATPCTEDSEQDSDICIPKVSAKVFYGNNGNNVRKSSNRSSSRKKESETSSSDTASSTDSYDSEAKNDEVKELYYQKILKLEADLKLAKNKINELQEQALDKDKTIEDQENKITQLQVDCQRYSKVNLDLSEKLIARLSSDATAKKGKSHVSKTLNFEEASALMSSTGSNVLSESDDADLIPVTSPSPSKKVKREKSSPRSSSKKFTPKQHIKTDKDNNGEDGIIYNEELFTMIVDALENKTPLQADGNGKVHLGNGVWISEKAWSDKIKKPSMNPSIAMRDAMSKIYKPEELAERSLEGGTPVKNNSSGSKIKKKKMTPAKREAMLGLYRAKTAVASGSRDKCFLDLAVSKKGKDTIRYKFKEAGKPPKG